MAVSRLKRLYFLLLLIGVLILGSCTLPFFGESDAGVDTGILDNQPQISIDTPQAARNAAMLYIRDHYGLFVPTKNEAWNEEDITPQGMVGSSAYQYIAGNWSASVIFPLVPVNEIIYTVLITNEGINFAWEGVVEAFGQVSETSSTTGHLSAQHSDEIAQTPTPTATSTPTPGITTLTYTDDTYRLALQYPSNWTITFTPPGRVTQSGGFAAKTLRLVYADYKLLIQYKFLWENTEIGESIPPGTLEVRGSLSLLGLDIPKHVIVEDGKDKLIFAGESIDDITYHIRLEDNLIDTGDYANFTIPANILDEVEQIISSIVRTGDIFPSPTPTPVPSPTSKFDSSKSGVGEGSTVSENCNKAIFISDVTVPEGAAIPPGVKFTKVWRLQNTGICTWDTNYSVAYSDGDLLGAAESNPLKETVEPNELGNVSVVFTAPENEGTYESYWILNDSQGYWFGTGENKRGLLPLKFNVAQPAQTFAYDFAINYCDAEWKVYWEIDGVTQESELECSGSTAPGSGFVTLLVTPNMEHRLDDELTLWVHPYEQQYGSIQGKYPPFTVQAGDRFKAGIGCMADMKGCSIDFQLLYKDAGGVIRTKDEWEWFEDYNGKATYLDIDLSFLAGETVEFILNTVTLTDRTNVAHGFWFVPRIERP